MRAPEENQSETVADPVVSSVSLDWGSTQTDTFAVFSSGNSAGLQFVFRRWFSSAESSR